MRGVRTSARTGLQPCRQLSLRGYGETRTWPYTGRVPAAGQAVTVRGRPADEQQRMGRRSWMAARLTGGGAMIYFTRMAARHTRARLDRSKEDPDVSG